jgi:hypothetical protein
VPIPTYTLSGTVFEMTPAGRVPVESVWVYRDSCGSPDGHTEVHSDTTGTYSFAWSANGPHRLLVRKAGFGLANPSGHLPLRRNHHRDGEGRHAVRYRTGAAMSMRPPRLRR